MEIRGPYKKIEKLKKYNKNNYTLTVQENLPECIMMVKDSNGKLIEYLRGFKPIKEFLKYGYNRIRKQCPLRHRKCIGEKCSFYIIHNNTGDCAFIWNFILEQQK